MKRRILSSLMALVLCLTLLPAAAYAAGGTAVYVSSSGSDGNGGTQTAPYATLAKAVTEAEDGSTIYVMSNLTMTKCARYYDKDLTITSLDPNNPVTISRGTEFDPQSDHARSWYNPAMIEVQTRDDKPAGLTLTNIIFDDDGKKEGTVFAQAVSDGSIDNKTCVQDAIIASNATVPSTITLGDGAVLRNFGGMSAVRVTDQAKLVMKSGSVIEDASSITRSKGDAGSVGPAGAVWLQGGSLEMENGAEIRNINGRAVYADGGSVSVGGTISNITGNANMWQGEDGTAIHLRNNATGTLTATGLIEKVTGGGTIVKLSSSTYTMDADSVMECNEGTNIAARDGTNTIFMNGEITGIKKGRYNAINLQAASDAKDIIYCKIGPTGNIHDNNVWYGSVYLQGNNIELHHYGQINNNSSSDKSGGIVLANNMVGAKVFMYDKAEINGNSSQNDGAGVMVSCGTFTMHGGKISGNKATGMGGGVYIRRGGQFIMNGGEICGNKSDTIGGGISLEAGDYNSWVPRVQLNAGKVSGNTMNGNSNDLAITDKEYGHIDRYLYISNDATIGNKAVYFQTNSKTVTPAEDSLDIKLGNASPTSVAALSGKANANGWSAPLATFWAQRDGAAELTVGGLTLDSALPQIVYALVQETGADGKPVSGAEIKVYSTEITTDGIRLTLPNGYANGCAVALAQPTTDFGRVVISGPTEIAKTSDAVTYEVPYTATYTMSNNLLSMLQHAPHGVPMTFVVELDSRLTAKKGADGKFLYDFDGAGILEVDENSITVNGNKITVPCNPVTDWKNAVEGKTSVVMTLKGTGVLAATGFDAGKYLNTTGHIEGKIPVGGTPLPIVIPANVCQTKMTAQTYTVTYDANGGSGTMTDKNSPYAYGAAATVLTNGFTRSRYTFTGWNTQADGKGTSCKAGDSIDVTGNIVLYAQWSKNSSRDDDDKYFFAIQKVDAQDGHALNDAKFELYQRDNRGNKLPASRKTTASWGTESGIALFSVSATKTSNGGSTWYYREITAPEGYVLDTKEYEISARDFYYDDQSKAVAKAKTVRNYRGTTPDLLNDSDHFAYVIGYMDGNVRPYGLISRAETTTIFFRLLKDSVRDGNLLTSNTYTDVADDYWANTAISTMTGLGIVQGRSTTTFDPKAPITRAQFAAICARFDTGKSSGTQTFTDIKGHWAEKYIERAAELGWIKGFEDGSFRPDTYITRAQAMTMINRVLNRIPEDESDLLPGMNVWPDCNPGDWFYLAVQEATNSHDFEHKAGNYETWTSLNEDPDWTRYEH